MSFYSLDSLEAIACCSNNSEDIFESVATAKRHRNLDTASSSNTNREIPDDAAGIQINRKPHDGVTRNPLIESGAAQAGPEILSGCRSSDESSSRKGYPTESIPPISADAVSTPVSIPKRISANSILTNKKSSSRTTAKSTSTLFKNDKKLIDVLAPPVIEAKTKPKTYLERYRERLGVKPSRKIIRSPEGSTLSVFGDSSYEPIPDVDSRPPTTTPRDDQSELSFYRHLINQPRTTRSCDVGDRSIANSNFRSVSDYGLTMNPGKQRLSYRPYSIKDYECLTVPRADRSLGPDIVEIREKWEKLMRRTQYGDLASSRNLQNVVRRSELRKFKRTKAQKHTDEFSLTEDRVAGQISEDSKNFRDTKISPRPLKENQSTLRPKQMLTIRSLKHQKTSIKSADDIPGPKSLNSLINSIEESIDDSSLEELQRRHQNEKRIMDLLVNRTLLR